MFSGFDPLQKLGGLAALAEDIVPLEWDGCPVTLLKHPDPIQRTLLTDQRKFVRSGGPPRLAQLLGNGLLRSQGEQHLRQRRLAQPAFHPSLLAHYGGITVELTAARFPAPTRARRIDFHREMTRLTLAIAAKAFFDLELEHEITRLGDAVSTCLACLPPCRRRLAESWRARRFSRALKALDNTLLDRIAKRAESGGTDLLSALLAARDEQGDGRGLSVREVRDELVTLFIAGHETTASTLSWALSLLAESPPVQQKMRQEIHRVLGDRPPRAEDVSRLPYTRGVFAEALRLYPPAWILFRRALENYELDGRLLPQGTHLLLSPYLMGRDSRFFPEPLAFRPERWAEDEPPPPKGAFFPFGLGHRKCLGEAFAWNEGVLVLAVLCRNLSWRRVPGARALEHAGFTLRPKRGVWVEISRS